MHKAIKVPDEALLSADAMLRYIAQIVHDQTKHPETIVYELGMLLRDVNSIENPCITREEFEKMGWKFQNELFGDRSFYSMGDFGLTFNPEKKRVMIEKIPRNILFNGECKDVKALKEICKKLKLK